MVTLKMGLLVKTGVLTSTILLPFDLIIDFDFNSAYKLSKHCLQKPLFLMDFHQNLTHRQKQLGLQKDLNAKQLPR